MLKPKLFTTIKDYNSKIFLQDLTAGIIVGIVALPLAIAFAIASGVSPEKGLYTAIVAGFLISALGGSRVQIGGPTGAFVVIVYGIVQQYGLSGLTTATILAGIILIIFGFARLGSVIKFIPYPVTVGFTSGIAVIIFSSQIKDFFGLKMGAVPADFIDKWIEYGQNFSSVNPDSLAVGAGSLLLMLIWQRFIKKVPGSLIALIVSTLIVQIFQLPVETIGSRFGAIPSVLPTPVVPSFDFHVIQKLISPAFTIAMLAGIEALLSAVVADGMIGGKHRSNMELVAQGVANIFSPLFGGIPATGAIARTATNIRNGGKTPVAGIIHAFVLLLIMLAFGRYAALIPLPVLAAILVIVAYNMSEWRSFRAILKSPKSDVVVLLATFFLTVLADLTVAIQIGILIAVFTFIRRMASVSNVGVITREFDDADEEAEDAQDLTKQDVPDGVEVYEVNGPFFFGAAYKFKEAMSQIEKAPKVRIIRMRNVPAIDSTGLHTLEEVVHTSQHQKIHLLFAGVHAQPYIALDQSGLLKKIGEENFFANIEQALDHARKILQRE